MNKKKVLYDILETNVIIKTTQPDIKFVGLTLSPLIQEATFFTYSQS